MIPPPRPADQRKQDALRRLEHDVDAWVATAGADGGIPYLVPLSFLWEGDTILIATPESSPTSRNILATGLLRLGVGPTRDVVLIEGTARAVPDGEISADLGDAFAAKTGVDPRELNGYRFFRVSPRRLLAWREANELAGRELMRDGAWTV